jgi:hypothetical protein
MTPEERNTMVIALVQREVPMNPQKEFYIRANSPAAWGHYSNMSDEDLLMNWLGGAK